MDLWVYRSQELRGKRWTTEKRGASPSFGNNLTPEQYFFSRQLPRCSTLNTLYAWPMPFALLYPNLWNTDKVCIHPVDKSPHLSDLRQKTVVSTGTKISYSSHPSPPPMETVIRFVRKNPVGGKKVSHVLLCWHPSHIAKPDVYLEHPHPRKMNHYKRQFKFLPQALHVVQAAL